MAIKILLLFIIGLILPLTIFAQSANDIEGIWYVHPDDEGHIPVVEIFEKDGKFYMYTLAYKNSEQMLYDSKNPNPELRALPIKGMVILYGLKYKEDGEWKGGKVYNPHDGKTYFANIKMQKDKNTITIKGYVDIFGIFGKSFQWTRTPPNLYKGLPEKEIRNPWGY